MTSRLTIYSAGLTLGMAAATMLAAPHRPALVALPSDWVDFLNSPEIDIAVFPPAEIFAGDSVGLDASTDYDPDGGKLQVRLDSPASDPLVEADFYRDGFSGNWRVVLPWMWASPAQPGWHTLFVSIANPGGSAGGAAGMLQVPVRILPAAWKGAQREKAEWKEAESACCEYWFLSDTEAERDIAELIDQTEATYAVLSGLFGVEGSPAGGDRTEIRMTIIFLPRLYGQGGLAAAEGILSYSDRRYTGADFPIVLKHEMAHLFTMALLPSGSWPPLLLFEGSAVYLTGGHYRTGEDLQARAAALLQSGKLIPLAELADRFSAEQHETAYIEAGAFTAFLAGRYGWERVLDMVRDPAAADSPGRAMDAMLEEHFGRTLAECEADWLSLLRTHPPDPATARDVEFTLEFFDTVRRYQGLYDPGGSMTEMWLPDMAPARGRRITADYLPAPKTSEAIALEAMFLAAWKAAGEGVSERAQETLTAVERVLDAKQRRVPDPMSVSSEAERYRGLSAAILKRGEEPLSIDLEGDRAVAETRDPATLKKETQRWLFEGGRWVREG